MGNLGVPRLASTVSVIAAAVVITGGAGLTGAATARADEVGYLVNVTVRPGYNFANATAALEYGYGICEKVRGGRPYSSLVGDIKSDFTTSDDFLTSYLASQAVDQLCPDLIWALRNSAAGYRPQP